MLGVGHAVEELCRGGFPASQQSRRRVAGDREVNRPQRLPNVGFEFGFRPIETGAAGLIATCFHHHFTTSILGKGDPKSGQITFYLDRQRLLKPRHSRTYAVGRGGTPLGYLRGWS
jgi:hypothetical protein